MSSRKKTAADRAWRTRVRQMRRRAAKLDKRHERRTESALLKMAADEPGILE